jgi:hypothetical protein
VPIRPSLLVEIQNALGGAIIPSLTAADAASDIFEAYILSLVIGAARAEGATIEYRDVFGATPTTFVFRTSPGYIFSRTQPYTHAIIDFQNKPTLEAHVGVRVSGQSKVLHECDVAVLDQTEAETCRQNQVSPRSSKVLLAIECKFYSTNLPLGLARSFIGLESDLSARDCYFVVNTSSASVEKLLASKRRHWEHQIIPSSTNTVSRLRSSFQTAFNNFKARS